MKKRFILLIVLAILCGVYFLGPHPDTPVYTNDYPIITGNVDEFVLQEEAKVSVKTDNEAEISYFDSLTKAPTEYVLLYLHGYTACKIEGQPVYQDFAARYGCNIFAARLADQGIATEEPMLEYTAERLWKSAKLALAVAEKLGQKVIIMSTSTGGTLALKLASEFPEKVYALINLSPNIRPKPWNAALLNNPWGLEIGRLVMDGNYRILPNKDKNYKSYWYDKYRIESLVQMQNLVESTMIPETFEKVNCPVVNIYYFKDDVDQDPVVDVEMIVWMHDLLGTPEDKKMLVPVENANSHVIGCGLYSQDIAAVEKAVFSFSDSILNLEPATLAH